MTETARLDEVRGLPDGGAIQDIGGVVEAY